MNQPKIELNAQITSIGPAQSTSINSANFHTLLIHGGIAVAVIIALTYYNQVLLKSITKLFTANRQNE